MRILACGLALLLLTTATHAQAVGQITVYFDEAGTVRCKDSPGAGVYDQVWIYAEGLPCPEVTGVEYSVDYGPNLAWFGDFDTFPFTLGHSPTGISIVFVGEPQPGAKFLIHKAAVQWTTDCALGTASGPTVLRHPGGADQNPVYTCLFPPELRNTVGGLSETCCGSVIDLVGLDIRPGSCSNPFSARLPDGGPGTMARKGGVLPVAILGSETNDVSTIDISSIRLEGVEPLLTGQDLEDVASLGDNMCADEDGDGWLDLTLKFAARDIAAAIGTRGVGSVVYLRLGGAYNNGLRFTGEDFVTVVGNNSGGAGVEAVTDETALGLANPNPFNPVTRIGYSLARTQHVRLTVYNVSGRLVEELVNKVTGAGEHVVEWDAGNLPSGIYFYRLEAGDVVETRKAILLK